MTPMRAWIALALLCAACGSSPASPTPQPIPSPVPAPVPAPTPSKVTITATLTATVSGGSAGTFTTDVDRLPALVNVSAPGYLTRQAYIGNAAPRVDLIALAAPFDLAFYQQLARNGYEAPGSLEPISVLVVNPSIYLQTTGLSSSDVNALERAARTVVPAMTGGRLGVATFQSGADLKPDANGWIVAEIVNDVNANCGRSRVGATAGHIWLNANAKCGRRGSVIGTPSLFEHEIGHALGFWHVQRPDALMNAIAGLDATPTDAERYHAAIAYSRQSGNRDPDQDAVTSTPLAVRERVVVD